MAGGIKISTSARKISVSLQNHLIAMTAILGRFVTFLEFGDSSVLSDAAKASLAKKLSDSITALDGFAAAIQKPFSDSAGSSDTKTLSVGKAFSESSTVSEAHLKSTIKSLVETASSTELVSKGLQRSLTDLVYTTDDFDGAASALDDQTIQFIKATTDLVSATDGLALVANYLRGLVDSIHASEAIAVSAGKTLSDTASISDVILVFKMVARDLLDTMTATDSKTLSFGKGTTDQASASDTGFLRSQGYCDFSYFAEDYVGASITF